MYVVEPLTTPSFEGVAKPSISPSEIKSNIVANCLLFNVSGARYGVGGEGGPPKPLIILSVIRSPDLYKSLMILQQIQLRSHHRQLDD